jgi:hypothetical protein
MTSLDASSEPLQSGIESPDCSVPDADCTGAAPPIFLHTGWRSGGTWLWSRFRANPHVTAYYEPLHEILATLRADVVPTLRADGWPSRHPKLTRPYFEEFAPLLRQGTPGVRGFHHALGTENFFASAATELPELHAYIAMLLNQAAKQGHQPVLKFCRSIGRVGWMQRNFPVAVHIVVLRDPATQFGSAYWQYIHNANPYFLAMPLLALVRNRNDARVQQAVETMGASLPKLPAEADDAAVLAACHDHLRETLPEDWYRAFLALWTLAALSIPDSIDRIIDTDLLSMSAGYRAMTRRDLTGLTGVPLELDVDDTLNDDALDDHAVRASAVLGAPRTAIWQCHQSAIALLGAQGGPGWADTDLGARIGATLAQANLIAMDGAAVLRARTLERITNRHDLLARAERAERALDAVHASTFWRVTTKLRSIHMRFGSSWHAYAGR